MAVNHNVNPRPLTAEEKEKRVRGIYDSFATYVVFCGHCRYVRKTNMYIMRAEAFIDELKAVTEQGVPMPNILISNRCQIVMPYHKALDGMEEARLASKSFGSTKTGIPPFYSDKFAKIGFQVSELFEDEATLRDRIERILPIKNTLLEHLYHQPPLKADDVFEKLMSGEKKFADYPYFAEALENWKMRMSKPRTDDMSNTQDMGLEVFAAGGAAMRFDGTWAYGDMLAKNPDFEIGFFVAPIDDEGSAKMNVQVDQSFMVNPQAENADVAVDFMEYWLTQGIAWSEISQMPLNTGVVSDKLDPLVRTLAEL